MRGLPKAREVGKLLESYTYMEIARHFDISKGTVRARCRELYKQYGITDGNKRVKLIVRLNREKEGI